ncbi:YdcF family protein [Nitratiruptor sp. YY09-18]|uniref:YdcF family protein n=1 Tax=Nitratiruptor sp. YY09-18 TaxID=2724901 RepID=UPI001915E03B|nr:YdcF family protein [Nitratiruptor sp. YY09-18]BCD67209.1 hypothetical protein NitYY0918_C0079 [Nitratiruptor sp. YY09-18]
MIYLISKLVNAFILPPGIFILTFTIAALLVKRFKKLLFGAALVLWLLASHLGANLLLSPLQNYSFKNSAPHPQAVVILGAGKTNGAPNLPTTAMGTERIMWGIMEAKRRNLPFIYTGYENSYAKETIQEVVTNFSLPYKECDHLAPGCYVIEGNSKDTYENARFTRELFTKWGIKKPQIILVTSAFHMPRSYYLFRYFGFGIETAKTDYKLDRDPDIWDYLPRMDNYHASYYALHEYLGLLSLVLRGIL